MNPDLSAFIQRLESENRYEALRFILDLKQQRGYSVLQVYEDFLTPALNDLAPSGDENIDIWREHVRTAIIRTILENMVPFIEEERLALNRVTGKSAAVLCPPEEYHDVGARMASDILTIAGYQTTFVGSNTPYRVFQAGLAAQSMDYVAISVANPYHLISTRQIVLGIKEAHPGIRVILGGSATEKHPDIGELLHADQVVHSLSDLLRLEGGKSDETGL